MLVRRRVVRRAVSLRRRLAALRREVRAVAGRRPSCGPRASLGR
jgi:hypothetical protein